MKYFRNIFAQQKIFLSNCYPCGTWEYCFHFNSINGVTYDIGSFIVITIAKIDKHRYAIILYLEGLDYSKIAKILNSDRLTVERWIEKYGGENLKLIRNHRPVDSENIEGIYMARRDFESEKSKYKLQAFRKGFSIIERESKTHFQVLDGELTKTEDYIITIKDR